MVTIYDLAGNCLVSLVGEVNFLKECLFEREYIHIFFLLRNNLLDLLGLS